jgi:hypothetical protein
MKYSKYFGTKRRGFIKSESILARKGAIHFKNENIKCDNTASRLGAILTQIDGPGKFYIIAYASRKLQKHEKNYTPFLLEMQAAFFGMETFEVHLKG